MGRRVTGGFFAGALVGSATTAALLLSRGRVTSLGEGQASRLSPVEGTGSAAASPGLAHIGAVEVHPAQPAGDEARRDASAHASDAGAAIDKSRGTIAGPAATTALRDATAPATDIYFQANAVGEELARLPTGDPRRASKRRQLLDWLRSGDPRSEWRAAEALEKRGAVHGDEASDLIAVLHGLSAESAARGVVVSAIALAWSDAADLPSRLADLPASDEGRTQIRVLRALRYAPAAGFRAYVLDVLRRSPDEQAVGEAMSAEVLEPAVTRSTAAAIRQAVEHRIQAGFAATDHDMEIAGLALALTGTIEPGPAADAIDRHLAGAVDPHLQARRRAIVRRLRGEPTSASELRDLWAHSVDTTDRR